MKREGRLTCRTDLWTTAGAIEVLQRDSGCYDSLRQSHPDGVHRSAHRAIIDGCRPYNSTCKILFGHSGLGCQA